MKHFRVRLTINAEIDLKEIYTYIKRNDSAKQAAKIVDELYSTCTTLSRFPERGHIAKELAQLGQRQYREITKNPWRIVYRVEENNVIVYCILDGRRNIQSLLAQRLTRP